MPSRPGSSRLLDLAILLGVGALAGAFLVLLRLGPRTPLAEGVTAWVVPALATAAMAASASLAAAAIVIGLRRGSVAALLGATAAAAVAGGTLALALTGGHGALGASVAAAGLLGTTALVAARRRPLLPGYRARVTVAGAGLLIAEGAVLVGILPGAEPLIEALRVPVLGAAAAALVIGGAVARDRRQAITALAAAVGTAGVLADRDGSLELAFGLVALGVAGLAGLRAVLAPRSTTEPEEPVVDIVLRLLPDAVLRFDGHLTLVDWNPAASELLGIGEHAAGSRLESVLGIGLAEMPIGDEVRTLPGWAGGYDVRLQRADGGVVAIVSGHREPDEERLGRELRGTIEELLQARRTIDLQRAELERLQGIDPLTGVASRGAILERLRIEIAQARRYRHPLAVVLLDIDGFEAMNARHGVAAGDALLREVALRMRLRVREADALGRAGSDGFLAVLPHTDEAGAATFADALRHRLAQRPLPVGDELITVTASAGVAAVRVGEETGLDEVLARVGEALDSARAAGGDRIALDRRHGFARLGEAHPADPDEGAANGTT